MKKVTLQDGTEMEVMEASDIENAVKENTTKLTEEFTKKIEELTTKKDDDGKEEDPFIAQLKKEQDDKFEKQIKDAAYGNADLEAEIRTNMKSLEGSALDFQKALNIAQNMAVTNNPEKGFADIISGGGEGNDNAYLGGENNTKTLNPAVAKMLKSSIPGLNDETVNKLYEQTTIKNNNN